MKRPRVIFCDVYGTLLDVLPPPAEAEGQWQELLQATFFGEPNERTVSLEEVAAQCERIVQREHELARDAGIRNPEVDWTAVMSRALPALASLPAAEQADFLFAHMQLRHTLRLMPGASECLHAAQQAGILLGLVSNAQAYTLRKLDAALAGTGLSREAFDQELMFWSFVEGFGKPDPGVFKFLTERLAERGFVPGEALVVGDRLDNDIVPAKAEGFATWWLAGSGDGDWAELRRKLETASLV